jgi:hypothetical protein
MIIPLLMFKCTRSFVSFCFKLIWIWYCIVLCLTCCSSHFNAVSFYVVSYLLFYVVSYLLFLGLLYYWTIVLYCIEYALLNHILVSYLLFVVLEQILQGHSSCIESATPRPFVWFFMLYWICWTFILYRIIYSSDFCNLFYFISYHLLRLSYYIVLMLY